MRIVWIDATGILSGLVVLFAVIHHGHLDKMIKSLAICVAMIGMTCAYLGSEFAGSPQSAIQFAPLGDPSPRIPVRGCVGERNEFRLAR